MRIVLRITAVIYIIVWALDYMVFKSSPIIHCLLIVAGALILVSTLDTSKAKSTYKVVKRKYHLYQDEVNDWMQKCFGPEIAKDVLERNHRFIEEAIELVQSLDCPKEDVQMLLDYVYSRPKGNPKQEVGCVMVTLAALSTAIDIDTSEAGEEELKNIWTKIDKIREKQKTKPKNSPLPTDHKPIPQWKPVKHITDIEPGNKILITGDLFLNNILTVERVKTTPKDGTEIIYDVHNNYFFNLGMYLSGESWVKELYVLR